MKNNVLSFCSLLFLFFKNIGVSLSLIIFGPLIINDYLSPLVLYSTYTANATNPVILEFFGGLFTWTGFNSNLNVNVNPPVLKIHSFKNRGGLILSSRCDWWGASLTEAQSQCEAEEKQKLPVVTLAIRPCESSIFVLLNLGSIFCPWGSTFLACFTNPESGEKQ